MKPVSRSFHLCHSGERETTGKWWQTKMGRGGKREVCNTITKLIDLVEKGCWKDCELLTKKRHKATDWTSRKVGILPFYRWKLQVRFSFFFFLSVRQASPGWHQSTSGEAWKEENQMKELWTPVWTVWFEKSGEQDRCKVSQGEGYYFNFCLLSCPLLGLTPHLGNHCFGNLKKKSIFLMM